MKRKRTKKPEREKKPEMVIAYMNRMMTTPAVTQHATAMDSLMNTSSF
jgi:hypothetical protein